LAEKGKWSLIGKEKTSGGKKRVMTGFHGGTSKKDEEKPLLIAQGGFG